jgi:pimeloyl-ACP methyl ester carboxylesterase
MAFVTSTDGARIFYTTIGQGEPLVLCHGLTHTWQSWQDLRYVDDLKDQFRLRACANRRNGRG